MHTQSTVVDTTESMTFMESPGLTLLQRLHEPPGIIGQMCVYAFPGENVHSFVDDLKQAVSWKEKSPNPLTQTPQEVSSPIPMPQARSSLGSVLPRSTASSRIKPCSH